MASEFWEEPIRDEGLAGVLFREVAGDHLPGSVEVRDAFGFDKMKTMEDEGNLLGVFQGLKLLGVNNRDVEEWRERGTLRESIIKFYSAHNGRSGYITWFKKNKNILETLSAEVSSKPSHQDERTIVVDEDKNFAKNDTTKPRIDTAVDRTSQDTPNDTQASVNMQTLQEATERLNLAANETKGHLTARGESGESARPTEEECKATNDVGIKSKQSPVAFARENPVKVEVTKSPYDFDSDDDDDEDEDEDPEDQNDYDDYGHNNTYGNDFFGF